MLQRRHAFVFYASNIISDRLMSLISYTYNARPEVPVINGQRQWRKVLGVTGMNAINDF